MEMIKNVEKKIWKVTLKDVPIEYQNVKKSKINVSKLNSLMTNTSSVLLKKLK